MRSLTLLLAVASVASAQALRVGAAQVTISPPAGTPMAGYYATRLSTGVHDDLHAKAIVIASGDQRRRSWRAISSAYRPPSSRKRAS